VALDPIRLLKKYYPLLVAAGVLGAVLGAGAHFILAKTSPQYTSAAVFEVRGVWDELSKVNPGALPQDELQRFMGTQIATITSPPILERVAGDPEVERTSWGQRFKRGNSYQPKDAQVELERELAVRTISQTNLFRVSFTWKDPVEARQIVEAVTRVYLDDLRKSSNTASVDMRNVLNREIDTLSGQITDLNKQRTRLLGDNRIQDISEASTSEDVRIRNLNDQLVLIIANESSTKSQLARYTAMLEEPAPDYPETLRDMAKRDPVVTNLDSQIANSRADLDTLKRQELGDEHPTVRSVRSRVDATQKERELVFEQTLRKLFAAEIDRLRITADGLTAQRNTLTADLEQVGKRKEDLTLIHVRLKEIEEEIARKTEQRTSFEVSRRNVETITGNTVFDRVKLRVQAQTPPVMSFPKLAILVPVGVLLLTGLTAGVVLLREVFDQRVRGPGDLAVISRLRMLGMLPDAGEDPTRPTNLALAFREAPSGSVAEAFRLLRSPLAKAMDQSGHKSLLVLAGMPGSGATTVVTNLALASAGAEEKTLIIDANLRRPAIHKLFGLSEGPGLGDVLAGSATINDAIRATNVPNLYIMSAGTSANRNIPERLGGASMGRLLGEVNNSFDRIFLDSAPAIVSGDGLALSNRVNAVTLVVRAMNEKRGLVNRVRNQLAESRGEFLGVIVNAVRASAGGYLRGNIKVAHEYQNGPSQAS
jgi:capsular exopolysaccharide synthesis family protein